MRVLHYYSSLDDMVDAYVSLLTKSMDGMVDSVGSPIENLVAKSQKEARQLLSDKPFDIVDIHGCWHVGDALVARAAHKAHARIVVTPHGQLEPWIIRQDYWKEKMPKTLAFQKNIVTGAYAVIVMGKMEAACMRRLCWNSRVETILNALITETTTEKNMAKATAGIFAKVTDSNVYELMDADCRLAMASLIKAGLAGDSRYLTNEEAESCRRLNLLSWRHLLLYAYHTKVSDTVAKGADVLRLAPPDIDVASIPCYLPIDNSGEASPTDTDIVTFTKRLYNRTADKSLTLSDMLVMAARLRQLDADEDAIVTSLSQKHLYGFTSSLMDILRQWTRLEEGFMLTAPKHDRGAKRIDRILSSQLSI